jgi:hypothetical protein
VDGGHAAPARAEAPLPPGLSWPAD